MVLLMRGFLFLFLVIVPIVLVIICFVLILRHIQKDAEENNEPTLWTSKPKPPVPSKYIDDKPVIKHRMIHLKTVYIPYPISQNIEEIVTSVSDSEYELGYGFDTMYTQKTDTGLVLFMRFQLL